MNERFCAPCDEDRGIVEYFYIPGGAIEGNKGREPNRSILPALKIEHLTRGSALLIGPFGIGISNQEFDFSGDIEINPSASSANREMNVSSHGFDFEDINNIFGPM